MRPPTKYFLTFLLFLVLALTTFSHSKDFPFTVTELFVSPEGSDNWSGRLAAPNADRSDGPLATIQAARDIVYKMKGNHWHSKQKVYSRRPGSSIGLRPQIHLDTDSFGGLTGPVVVWLRGGVYQLSEPIEFSPYDSAPVTYAAYPGETPILSGGVQITDWRVEQLRGKSVWVADLPEVAKGKWNFRQLFVNGKRAQRARLPKKGFYWVDDPLLPSDQPVNVHSYVCNRFRAGVSGVLGAPASHSAFSCAPAAMRSRAASRASLESANSR